MNRELKEKNDKIASKDYFRQSSGLGSNIVFGGLPHNSIFRSSVHQILGY